MAILALAKQLYGASLLAYSVTLTGQSFDYGDTLSAVAARGPAVPGDQGRRARPPASDSTAGFLRIEQDVESFMQGQA